MSKKRANGVYYTEGNPFTLSPFKRWAAESGLRDKTILEPFAGANNIIRMLRHLDLCRRSASFDITPTSKEVRRRDTLANFPTDYPVCVTNPPWLARNSATRRGLPFPTDKYDNIYKRCLELCLRHCEYVAALIPASFIQSRLFADRLSCYILLHNTIFDDTENPVCLALFNKRASRGTRIYYDDEFIGDLITLREHIPEQKGAKAIRFNDPDGELGFISFDSTKEPTIRFCRASDVAGYSVKQSSRFITRIAGNFGKDIGAVVKRLNKMVDDFRHETRDVFLTPFKGLRSDGMYRRRMDFALARRFINAA